jgi:hypothetical protein
MRRLMKASLRWPAPAKVPDEQGAVAIMVALLMVALVGFGALAVDIGHVAAEKAQLQNGADASALAIASNCAKFPGTCTASGIPLAEQYTPANSNDASAVPQSVTFPAADTVTVVTSTPAGGLPLSLARVLGITSADVTASATAIWGYPTNGSGFPLALSNSCFDLASASESGDLQKFSYKPGNGKNAPTTDMKCTKNASGQSVSGGWGWLSESAPCEATSGIDQSIPSDPGNDPGDCKPILDQWIADLTAGKEVEVQFPVFDYAAYQGNSASYHILGYATLRIYAWQFSGTGNSPFTYMPSSLPANMKCQGSERCVVGRFVKFEETDPTAGTGGTDYGTTVVRLSQ